MEGFKALGAEEWGALAPLLCTLAFIVISHLVLLSWAFGGSKGARWAPRRAARRRSRARGAGGDSGLVNRTVSKDAQKVVHTVDIEDLASGKEKQLVMCRCWKSKKVRTPLRRQLRRR